MSKVESKRLALKRGPVNSTDRDAIEAIMIATPKRELTEAQIGALEILLKRKRSTIVQLIDDVRDKLAQNAGRYADLHLLTAEKAFELGDSDPKALETARRAAEFALSKISARDDKGNVHKIVEDSTATAANVPQLRIGIALGGMRNGSERNSATVIDADVITQDNVTRDDE